MNQLDELASLTKQVRDHKLCRGLAHTPFYWQLTYGNSFKPRVSHSARTFGDVHCMRQFLGLLDKATGTTTAGPVLPDLNAGAATQAQQAAAPGAADSSSPSASALS